MCLQVVFMRNRGTTCSPLHRAHGVQRQSRQSAKRLASVDFSAGGISEYGHPFHVARFVNTSHDAPSEGLSGRYPAV
jgi:hypothetical protein